MLLNGSHCYLYGINVTKHVKKCSKECDQTFVLETIKTILKHFKMTLTHKNTCAMLKRNDATSEFVHVLGLSTDSMCIPIAFLMYSYLQLLW